MEKERKGCLIMLAVIFLTATGVYIAFELDWPYLKHLSMMLCTMIGGYVGNTYHRFLPSAKPTPKKYWVWYFLAIFVLAGIFTWIECHRK